MDEVNHVKNGCLICVILLCWFISFVYMMRMIMNAVQNVSIDEKITKFFIFADFLNAL